MRTPLHLAAASVAAATLVVTAAGATADPISSAPVTAIAAPNRSGATAARSAAGGPGIGLRQRGGK
uniref:hypothetical protein n=1 Tax=Nocardia gipuzkoensis TaxID=2749991 RepID=UPI002455C7EB